MIVLDASAAIELILGTLDGTKVAARIADPAETLHAPHLIDIEVAQVMRRYADLGTISGPRGRAALQDLADLDLARYAHDALLPRVWQLRRNLTAYDAAYVALAEALGAPLLTLDARLAGAPGHRARIERP